jgi:hypothetical protein
MTDFSAAKRRPRNPWDRQAIGVPNFSYEAAFLLDAMAALPRKWVKPEVDPPRFYALPRALKTKGSSVAFFAPLRAGSLARCAL